MMTEDIVTALSAKRHSVRSSGSTILNQTDDNKGNRNSEKSPFDQERKFRIYDSLDLVVFFTQSNSKRKELEKER
jgi:hypothetical protein